MVLTQRNWKTSNWYVDLISEQFDYPECCKTDINLIEIYFHCLFFKMLTQRALKSLPITGTKNKHLNSGIVVNSDLQSITATWINPGLPQGESL